MPLIFLTPIPLSLYIHLPWCVRKCPYCDFNSHAVRDHLPEDLYVAALMRDLEYYAPLLAERNIISIFLGGGTPSLFSPRAIERILTGVSHRCAIAVDVEVTLEANPGTLEANRFRDFKQAGVNRLSLGIQSLQNDKLQALGRIHDRDQALRAIDYALQAEFKNFNLDLMHGLPGQSLEDAMADLQTLLQYQPPHLSWYQLTIEPNTFFHYQPPTLPTGPVLEAIDVQGKQVLAEAGWYQYEVSAYARPGHECIHNKNYWEFGDYIGIGAGAHSKLTDMLCGTVLRFSQVKHPNDYLKFKKDERKKIELTSKDLIFEFMLNALRLAQGVPMQLFTERTGLPVSVLSPYLQQARAHQLLVDDVRYLRASELGFRFLNDLIAIFLG